MHSTGIGVMIVVPNILLSLYLLSINFYPSSF